MNTLIRYSACLLITGVVFASGYVLGQHQATTQTVSFEQQDLSTLVSETSNADGRLTENKTPRRKLGFIM